MTDMNKINFEINENGRVLHQVGSLFEGTTINGEKIKIENPIFTVDTYVYSEEIGMAYVPLNVTISLEKALTCCKAGKSWRAVRVWADGEIRTDMHSNVQKANIIAKQKYD